MPRQCCGNLPTTNVRGTFVANWVHSMNFICLNQGGKSTCIRSSGESIVDLTFANQKAAARILNWEVSNLESASDHRYIEISFGKTNLQIQKEKMPNQRRWAVKKLDEDLLRAAIIVGSWNNPNQPVDIEISVANLQKMVSDACETAMPKSSPRSVKAMPWWNDELSQLRAIATRARRKLKRFRRQENLDDQLERDQRIGEYKEAKRALSKALRKFKALAWKDFVGTLNENPWSRPY